MLKLEFFCLCPKIETSENGKKCLRWRNSLIFFRNRQTHSLCHRFTSIHWYSTGRSVSGSISLRQQLFCWQFTWFRTWALFAFNSFVGVFRSSSLFFLGLSRVNKSILSSIFSNLLLVIVSFFLSRWRFNFVWPLYYKSGYTLFTVVTTIQVGERTNNDDEDWKRERKYRPATNCLDPTPKNQIQLFGLHWVLLFVTSVSSFTFLRLQLKIPNWVKQFI